MQNILIIQVRILESNIKCARFWLLFSFFYFNFFHPTRYPKSKIQIKSFAISGIVYEKKMKKFAGKNISQLHRQLRPHSSRCTTLAAWRVRRYTIFNDDCQFHFSRRTCKTCLVHAVACVLVLILALSVLTPVLNF